MKDKLASAGIVGTLLSATLLVAAPPAQAAARDGVCQPGEFCLYDNSDQQGSVSDFAGSVPDYGATQPGCYEFKSAGAGRGLCVKNRAASVWNRTSRPVTVYYNSGWRGSSQATASGSKGNLGATLKNENASHRFATNVSGRSDMSYSLYDRSGGRITAGFDGYRSTQGRHEGIDIARGIGSPVRALVGGEVVHVARGSRGRAGLSTISIYNAAYRKTVIYLHSAPLPSISVGERISRDQQIATEDWRGVSSPGSRHTHVEMRPGRQLRAAVSVGTSAAARTLENPNPTTFWNGRGYRVR